MVGVGPSETPHVIILPTLEVTPKTAHLSFPLIPSVWKFCSTWFDLRMGHHLTLVVCGNQTAPLGRQQREQTLKLHGH